MSVQLSSGALEAINDGQQIDKPVFQLLAIKKLNPTAATNNAVDRYRIMLSDGIHNNTAMLAVQLNQMVADGQLEPNTVICLDRYVCNKLAGNRRVVIILELTVVVSGDQVGGKIGNPVALPLGGGGGSNGQQAPVQQHTPVRPGASPMGVAKANSFPGAGSFNKQGNYGGAGPSSGMTSPPKQAQPISSLTPYQNRWTIKARVSNKSSIRTWSNSRGEGKLFSMDLCDQSGEIRATAFKDQCDKFFDMIEVGKVYFFARGTLKTAKRQYTSITNDYEMSFNNDTTVVPCDEEDDSIPSMQFDFRTIGQLEDINKDTILVATDAETGADSSTTAARPTATVTPVAVLAPKSSNQATGDLAPTSSNQALGNPAPTATVTPVAVLAPSPSNQAAGVLVPTTSIQALGAPMQPQVQAHQVAFIRPMSEGVGPNQQVLPGHSVFVSQRAPGPGMTQQTFAFRGAAPVIRFVQHHHGMPGPRGPPPASAPTTTSVTSTASGTTTTSTVTGPGQSFQIHFHHRPGYPPQPVIRLIQDGPPPPPGVHRCMHAHHGHPVFRTPPPTAQSTSAQPTRTHISTQSASRPVVPAPAAAAVAPAASVAAASAAQPAAQPLPSPNEPQQAKSGQSPALPPRRPGPQDSKPDDKPELAQLAQHLRKISADVKTVKPGSRGVPRDPREKQRREAAEASNARRKEIKAKSKTLQTEDAASDFQSVKDPESTEAPAADVEASEISSSSSDSNRRRRRRKRGKQQLPTPEESKQNSFSEAALKDTKSNSDQQEATLGHKNKPDVETELVPSSKPDDENPARDSDDSSSESESEEATNLGNNPAEDKSNLERASLESTSPSCAEQTFEANHESERTDNIQLSSESSNVIMKSASASNTDLPTELNLEDRLSASAQIDSQTNSVEILGGTPQFDPTVSSPTENSHEEPATVVSVQKGIADNLGVDVKSKLMVNCGSDNQNQKTFECDPGPESDSAIKAPSVTERPSQDPQVESVVTTTSSEQHSQWDHSVELQRDHLKLERKQLALDRQRLDCERQNLLLKEERLQIEQDRLQAEQERLAALQEQVRLQRDQLELDRNRLVLERDLLEVNRERLQVERHRFQGEEQRGEDSKMILQSLQEISQSLQMSVNLSLQGYGFPMSYETAEGDPNEYMQQQSFLGVEAQGVWPVETGIPGEGAVGGGTFNSEEEILEDSGDEWTVVGRTRATSHQREFVHSRVQERSTPEGSVPFQGTVDAAMAQGAWTSEQPAPSSEMPPSFSIPQVQQFAKTESSKEPAAESKGTKSGAAQKSGEGRSLSPVHGLSGIQGRQGTRQNPNRREYRQGRPDSRRGRDRKHHRPNEPKNDKKKVKLLSSD